MPSELREMNGKSEGKWKMENRALHRKRKSSHSFFNSFVGDDGHFYTHKRETFCFFLNENEIRKQPAMGCGARKSCKRAFLLPKRNNNKFPHITRESEMIENFFINFYYYRAWVDSRSHNVNKRIKKTSRNWLKFLCYDLCGCSKMEIAERGMPNLFFLFRSWCLAESLSLSDLVWEPQLWENGGAKLLK